MPLTEAARQNDARLVKMLLDAGAKVDSANPDGETALMLAIKGGDLPDRPDAGRRRRERQSDREVSQPDAADVRRCRQPERAHIVKLLLSKGADVKPRALYSDWPSQVTSEPRTQYRSVGGLNALMYAARGGCYSCVEDLVAAGADVNLPTPEGHHAADDRSG